MTVGGCGVTGVVVFTARDSFKSLPVFNCGETIFHIFTPCLCAAEFLVLAASISCPSERRTAHFMILSFTERLILPPRFGPRLKLSVSPEAEASVALFSLPVIPMRKCFPIFLWDGKKKKKKKGYYTYHMFMRTEDAGRKCSQLGFSCWIPAP